MVKFFAIVGLLVSSIVFAVAWGLFMALPVMLLWDVVMPKYFGLKEITWLDAWALNMLVGFLFPRNSAKSS